MKCFFTGKSLLKIMFCFIFYIPILIPNTFGIQVSLAKNTDFTCSSDGYFQVEILYEKNSNCYGNINGVQIIGISVPNGVGNIGEVKHIVYVKKE